MPVAAKLGNNILTTAEAASRLGISVRRVQQLVKSGRLPASTFGGSLVIAEKDLALVADRKTGRPKKGSATAKDKARSTTSQRSTGKGQRGS